MTLDEFLSTGKPTDTVRIVSASLLTIVSIFGSIFNTLVFLSLLLRVNKKDGFLKICCTKSFGNDIVCIGYLVWPIPVTFLNKIFVPHIVEAFMGQLIGWFGWSIGPLSQVLLTSNRMLAVFFPHLYHRSYKFAPSNVGIVICLVLSFLLFAAFFPEGCHYLYNLDYIGWLPEKSLCTTIRRSIFIVSMIIIVIITSVCGVLLFFKLIADSNTMSALQSSSRRSKNQKILFQTLTQNFLILADTLNTTVTYEIFPVLFFQFLTLSFSMVFLRALEGFIMFKMNERINKGVKTLLGMKTAQLKNLQGAQSVMIWNVSTCRPFYVLEREVGETVYVPQKSAAPFPISPNFNCTLDFVVLKGSYLRLSVINSLLDQDYILFVDSVGYRRNLTVTSIANEELFTTTGKGSVTIMTGPQGRSKALLVFQWLKMPKSTWTESLRKNQSGTNVDCMAIQQNPITFTAEEIGEKIALNIAHSAYILDKFDSYFIFDGPDTDSPVVGRMSSHVVVPFIPSNQSVTIIGLTKQVVYSNIIANIKSNIGIYRKYQAAVVIDQFGGQLDSINQTIGVTFIAKDANQLYITYLKFNEIENEKCEMRIISGTPSPISTHLLSYTPNSPLDISFPQQFPASQFTAELFDCSVYMVISKNTPAGFYMIPDERVGYAFTPSFLDSQQTPFLNFTLSSNQTRHFSTTVESVTVYNEQILTINVMNSKGVSAMSAVITGNQTGGSAEGIGTSVNINFSGLKGQGQAKIRYHISKISDTITGFTNAFFIFILFMIYI